MFLNIHDVVLGAREISSHARHGSSEDISLDKAELVAIFIEALLYGIEALTFVATVYLLHGAKRTKSLFVKFSAVIIMFLLNTIHVGSSLRRILNAFVGTLAEPVPDAVGYLADLAGFLYRFKNILIMVQIIMLDVLIVYRCYMIWDRKIWVTLVPSLGIIASLVTGIAAIHAFATYDALFTGRTRAWVAATLCITLFTKLVCLATVILGTLIPRPTSLWHTSYLKVNRHAKLYKSVLIGIESGGIAALGAFVLVPVYLAGQNAQGILWAAMSPLSGEAFLLIVIAALLGLTPSASGTSRRRKGGTIPAARVSIPNIPVSPISSPTSRFSTAGSLFKSSSSTVSPSTPSDYSKSGLPFAGPGTRPSDPVVTYSNSRYSRGYVSGEPLPFSTAFVTHDLSEESSCEASIGDIYSDGEAKRPDTNVLRPHPGSQDALPGGAFQVAQSADGEVEVLQKGHAAS